MAEGSNADPRSGQGAVRTAEPSAPQRDVDVLGLVAAASRQKTKIIADLERRDREKDRRIADLERELGIRRRGR